MENELQILNSIEKNEYATQRDLAKSTGMSLGNVNLLIKRLVKKGMIKIERLNAKTIRYILTPQGMKEKAEATYNYVVYSYRFISDINRKIDELISSQLIKKGSQVILLGNRDEICEIIQSKFSQAKIRYTVAESVEEPTTFNLQLSTIIAWHPDFFEALESRNIEYINVLDRI